MIVKENVVINGKEFRKTYSDKGMKIEREGVQYDEAIDPTYIDRQYVETDVPVEIEE